MDGMEPWVWPRGVGHDTCGFYAVAEWLVHRTMEDYRITCHMSRTKDEGASRMVKGGVGSEMVLGDMDTIKKNTVPAERAMAWRKPRHDVAPLASPVSAEL